MDSLFPLVRADLHMHTTCSDGALGVREVVAKAHAAGLTIISITDHDTVDAVAEATEAATALKMQCIPGIELTTRCEHTDVHLLGYFFDYTSPVLAEYVAGIRAKRISRAERIVAKLNAIGVLVKMEDVMRRAGRAAVGRPHIAAALIDCGVVPTYQRAFQKYLSDTGPGFVHVDAPPITDGVAMIHGIGGLAVIAHPGILREEVLKQALESGVDGIEVVHPSHPPGKTAMFRGIATEYFLVQTGGSDFHGGARSDAQHLGAYFISEEYVAKMRSALRY